MSAKKSSNMRKVTKFIWPSIILGWALFSIFVIEPIIKEYSTESITPFNGSFLTALGILIGFAGLSSFYYLGKFGELSSNIRSEGQKSIISSENDSLELKRMILKIKKITKDAVDSGQSKEVIAIIQEAKSSLESKKTNFKQLEKSAKEQNERVGTLPVVYWTALILSIF